MKPENETANLAVIRRLLHREGLVPSLTTDLHIEAMAGDGSSRKFWRISTGTRKTCLAVAPPCRDRQSMAEAKAARAIGMHLLHHNIPVPEQYGWDADSGILLFEDFGDCKLHDYVLSHGRTAAAELYKKVLVSLATMQLEAAKSFQPDWCWDSPKYDRTLMLERESGYFLRAFWQELLKKDEPAGLQEEFEHLASQAALISADYFLHRDFQSRNIMLVDESPCFIDFQGGRLGPLGYDLASLLIDPYVTLPVALQEELLGFYMDILADLVEFERTEFITEYKLLALHRNLQIVGAFAFLSMHHGKLFFRQFLQPALVSLQRTVASPQFDGYPILKKCVKVSGQEFLK